MPNRSATRASGFINPSEGLSFSGAAVVVQQQTTALKQTSDTATYQTSTQTDSDFQHAGLLAETAQEGPGFSGGLLSPLESPLSVTSSSSAENDPEAKEATAEGATESTDGAAEGTDGSAATTENAAVPPSNCSPSANSLYCVYEVQEGDTLSTIANLFGLTSTEDVAQLRAAR